MVIMMETGQTVDYYKYRPLPWISKSRLQSNDFCEFNFYLGEIQQATPRGLDDEMEEKGIVGTNSHLVMAKFWEKVKEQNLVDKFMEIKLEDNPKNSQLYWAFYSVCEDLIPKEAKGVPEFMNVLSNFAEFQVMNWTAVTRMIGKNKTAYLNYWMPDGYELFLENREQMIFGTMDVCYKNPNVAYDKHTRLIIDYKSGNVPKAIREFAGQNPFSQKLPTNKLEELHFYAWLAATSSKYEGLEEVYTCNCKGRIVLREDQQYTCQKCNAVLGFELPSNVNKEVVPKRTRAFTDVSTYKDFLICMIFLGGDRPYVVPKTPNDGTMQNVLTKIDALRNKWAEQKDNPASWKKNLSDFVCPKCYQAATCTEVRMREALSE